MFKQWEVSADWDIKVTQIDLMLEELKKMNLPESTTTVGVLGESIVDESIQNVFPVKVIWEGSFHKNKDKIGHATAVASKVAQSAPGTTLKSYHQPVGHIWTRY